MAKQTVIVVDFGAQYNQLVARRVRECGVYSEVVSHTASAAEIRSKNPVGIILTGGPSSVYGEGAPFCDAGIFEMGIPVLGIGYGAKLMCLLLGGKAKEAEAEEFGRTGIKYGESRLFEGMEMESICWMSHGDLISSCPAGFVSTAVTESCEYAGLEDSARNLYGVQFHPEVANTDGGQKIIENFLFGICGCRGDWRMADYAEDTVASLRAQIGDGKVLLALSGGVDSAVCAALLHRAVGDQLICIFVDHGFMRKDEPETVARVFGDTFGINLISVDAGESFLAHLAGVTDPERKRKIIGEQFIRVFEKEAKKIGAVDFLAQGTIYPDVIESGSNSADVIKSHHNVGGLPDYVDFKEIVEPIRPLFKDEVRALGSELGLPSEIVNRQPFPGPGLAIRVIGEITKEKLDILRDADAIFRSGIEEAGLTGEANQYFAVITDLRSVGVMGDSRTYDYTLALRSVKTNDFMTADWTRIPYDVLERVSTRIINEVAHINRIVYDITSKPPATIEWE